MIINIDFCGDTCKQYCNKEASTVSIRFATPLKYAACEVQGPKHKQKKKQTNSVALSPRANYTD
jgi:hypothetical protein